MKYVPMVVELAGVALIGYHANWGVAMGVFVVSCAWALERRLG